MQNKSLGILASLLLITCATTASAEGFPALNATALSAIGSVLNRQFYTGVTAQGAPCRVDVARMGGVLGGPGDQIFLTGYDYLPGFPIQRVSGYFQIGSSPRFYRVLSHVVTPEAIQTTVFVPNPTPQIGGIGTWQGSLTVGLDTQGYATSVRILETAFDPISNTTSSRAFYCGEAPSR